MTRKFKVTVERTDEYIIEIDENVMTEEWMDNYRQVFYDFDTIEDHVEHVAQLRARFHNTSFYGGNMEGYGDVALKGEVRSDSTFPFPAVNIVKADEDNDVDVDVFEIKKEDVQ